ncbi:MAG: mannose-1-phosphate guanylyltransferase [Spirochaetaceae bacterium]|jgi:mannose-1-phosphate guanylyltransferase/mannose-6-phosphate isomerase|nr:mannose-1-phosphate guanylyltransferase [Spirochaetaceae bacterium]
MFDDCLIMAGGTGTRLWPASRSAAPKQFLPISPAQGETGEAEKTFFHAALERAFAAVKPRTGQVMVIAGEAHAPKCAAIGKTLDPETRRRLTIIPEPDGKNTAPAIACGLYYAEKMYGEGRSMLVLTSDHLIRPLAVFQKDAEAAAGAARGGNVAVFGIPPRGPETGYGYIEAAADAAPPLYRVASFREKPDRETARTFLAAGRFYWNSGMFAFSSQTMKEAFRVHAPDIASLFESLPAPYTSEASGVRVAGAGPELREAYRRVRGVSFDYALAEKLAGKAGGPGRMVMVKAGFDWQDAGSWDEYAVILGKSRAEVYESGSASCFVDSPVPVALCGVEDLIVTVSLGGNGEEAAVLVAKKGETQRVRDIVEQIKLAGRTKLL